MRYFGSDETPELTLGELVRIAVALPLFVEAVRVEGDLYVDGGVVDAFPAEPMIAAGDFDRVFGLNVMLPPASRARTSAAGKGAPGACWTPRGSCGSRSTRNSRVGVGGDLAKVSP